MRGSARTRQLLTRVNALVVLAMIVMPVGQPMPAVPDVDTLQAPASTLQIQASNLFGTFIEDDIEVEHHDFTIEHQISPQDTVSSTAQLISFLWTERLHRPPIA